MLPFEYELPRELIAQEPLPNRVDARLMVVDRKRASIDHYHVRDLPDLLRHGDRLVLNNTRVILARLVGKRALSGGRWQGLFLGAIPDGCWNILQKTRGNIQPGEVVHLEDREGRTVMDLTLVERSGRGEWVARPNSDEAANALLERVGRVPLPPYIRGGDMTDADVERYQTVFATNLGAVAAPTAGLHFTDKLLQHVEARGVDRTDVTLHVGLDTFRPIAGDSLDEHAMHSEWIELTQEAANQINTTRAEGGRIVAVGTTSVRVLESAAKCLSKGGAAGSSSSANNIQLPTAGQASSGTHAHTGQPCVAPFTGETDLFIRPPYPFPAVDVLLTNFHFPKTTLLVLVSTFAGRELLQRAYAEAVEEKYRFYSYGDAMLIV